MSIDEEKTNRIEARSRAMASCVAFPGDDAVVRADHAALICDGLLLLHVFVPRDARFADAAVVAFGGKHLPVSVQAMPYEPSHCGDLDDIESSTCPTLLLVGREDAKPNDEMPEELILTNGNDSGEEFRLRLPRQSCDLLTLLRKTVAALEPDSAAAQPGFSLPPRVPISAGPAALGRPVRCLPSARPCGNG